MFANELLSKIFEKINQIIIKHENKKRKLESDKIECNINNKLTKSD